MAAKDIESAVHAAQLYIGSAGQRVQTEQKLYTRMQKKIESVAKKRNMNMYEAHEQIIREARRRGGIYPIPGKDF